MSTETFVVTNTQNFENPYSKEEQSQIISQIDNFSGQYIENSDTLRLDRARLEKNGDLTLELSKVSFHDFLSTNYAFANRDKIQGNSAFSSIERRLEGENLDDVHNLLSKPYLANTLSISCLIQDDISFLLVQRQLGLPIDGGILSTCTGTVRPIDLGNNVIFNSCARELSRLGITSLKTRFNFYCLMRNDQCQPCACVNYFVPSTQEVLDGIRKKNSFFDKYVCGNRYTFDKINMLLETEKLSTTTKAQLKDLKGQKC